MIRQPILASLISAATTFSLLLMDSVRASHFAKDANLHLFFQYNDNSSFYSNNETFFIPFEQMNLSHTDCKVITKNASERFELHPFNATKNPQHLFTGLVQLNVSDTISIDQQMRFKDNETTYLLDYKIDEADEKSCVLEQALVHNTNLKIWEGHTSLSQRWHCFNPFNISIPSTTVTYKGVILKYLQSIESKVFFDITLSHSGNTIKLEFRSGPLKADPLTKFSWNFTDKHTDKSKPFSLEQLWPPSKVPDTQEIRSLLLLEFSDTKVTDSNKKDIFNSYKLLSVGSFNFQFKQFIVYQVNTSTVYVVTSFNTGSKSSNITFFTQTMPFNFSKIEYVSNEFILFEEPIMVTDVLNKSIPTNMNYFIRLALGQRLDSSMFKNFRNLTKGKFQFSYSSTDRYLRILDFQLPDLDGIFDESLISSFYYSKSDIDFLQFLEESPTVSSTRKYEPSSYRRMLSPTHVIEIYNEYNNTNNKKTYLGVHSRTTGAYLGEIVLPPNRPLLSAKYVENENMFILSFDDRYTTDALPSLYFYSFTMPSIYFKTEFVLTKMPEKPDKNANGTTSLKVVCDVVGSNKPEEVFSVHFNMHDKYNNYFISTSTNFDPSDAVAQGLKPKPSLDQSSNCYPDGLKINIDVSKQVPGSFVEEQYNNEPLAKFFSNPNLRHELYEIEVDTLDINMPIFFETKKGTKTIKTMVMDFYSKTLYYKYRNGKFHDHKMAIDSRKVSKVDMIGEGDAIFNVSQNIFSLDIEDLTEKPLTGIGSFCQSVAYLRPPNLPDIVLCLSGAGLEAHYMQERFAAQQTNIAIKYSGFEAFAKEYPPKKLFYSREFPNYLLIMATNKSDTGNPRNYVLGIFSIFAVNDIFVSYESMMVMKDLNAELQAKNNSVLRTSDIHEGSIILATSGGVFFVYRMIEREGQSEALTIEFQRRFDLADHFLPYHLPYMPAAEKTQLSLKVVKFDKIWMYRERREGESYQTEQVYERRMLFLLEINKTRTDGKPQETHRIIVIFDHRKSSYEAFTTIVSGVDCENLHMGPAFLLEGEKQRRTITLICQQADTKKPANGMKVKLKVAILEAFENLLSFGHHKDLDSYAKVEFKGKVKNPATYPITFYKSKHLLDLKNLTSTKEANSLQMLQVKAEYKFCFLETYKEFGQHENLDENMTKISLKAGDAQFSDVFGRDQKFRKKEKIKGYFEGHVFNTSVECESPMECRDMIINVTSQLVYSGELGNFSEYQTSEDAYHLDHMWLNKSYDPNFELAYLMIRDSFIFSMAGQKRDISVRGLGQNCSEFTSYEKMLVALCLYENKLNFFRVFDIDGDMTYSDIVISFTNNRVIHPKSVDIKMQEDYIGVFTQNSFFRRYLTGLIFKVVKNINFTATSSHGSQFFCNPLQKNIGIWFLAESPMNDENVELMVYKTPNKPDRVYLWSLRRKTASLLSIRSIGYSLEETTSLDGKSKSIKPTRVCDEKLLTMFFKFSIDLGGSYLLDHGSIMPLHSFTEEYFDVILTLPFSHDYLVRFKRAALEKKTEDNNLNFAEDAKFLSISNPFFGIKESQPMRPEFGQNLYLVPGNFIPDRSIVRMYYIDSEIKDKAVSLTENKFFDFKSNTTKVGGKDSVSLYEGNMPTVYTFGLLNFSTFMTSVNMQHQLQQIDYFKKKLNGSI